MRSCVVTILNIRVRHDLGLMWDLQPRARSVLCELRRLVGYSNLRDRGSGSVVCPSSSHRTGIFALAETTCDTGRFSVHVVSSSRTKAPGIISSASSSLGVSRIEYDVSFNISVSLGRTDIAKGHFLVVSDLRNKCPAFSTSTRLRLSSSDVPNHNFVPFPLLPTVPSLGMP